MEPSTKLSEFLDRNDLDSGTGKAKNSLHSLIRSGNLAGFEEFLEENSFSLDALDSEGNTPLTVACLSSSNAQAKLAMARHLIELGAEVNSKTARGLLCPLLAACRQGSVELVRLLLESGADVNTHGLVDGTTPLVLACSIGNPALVVALLEKGPNIDEPRKSDGLTPLAAAWKDRHYQVVKLLLSVSAPSTPVSIFGNVKNREVALSILKAAGNTISGARGSASKTAAAFDAEVTRCLLQRLDMRAPGAAMYAAEFLAALSQLLLLAVSKGDTALATLLLEAQQIDPNYSSHGDTPLIAALKKSNHELARILLAKSADPNVMPDGMCTPLQICITKNDIEGVKLLLMSSANPNLALRSGSLAGQSPLRLALLSARNDRMVQLLLSAGAFDPSLGTVSSAMERDLSNLQLTDAEVTGILPRDSFRVVSLNLAGNLLQLPDTRAWRYPMLASLRLANNKLVDIPRGLRALTNLTCLDLTSNNLTDLTSARDDLPSRLSTLQLRGNPLLSIPLWLHRLPALQQLEFDQNPNLGIPLSVLRLPTPELFRFLRATESKSIRWNNAKLILVGEENVGKTSLSNYLVRDVLIDPTQPNVSTNGIEISDWTNHELQRSWRSYCSSCFEYYTAEQSPLSGGSTLSRARSAASMRSASPAHEPRTGPCPKCGGGTIVPDSLSLSVWDFGGQAVFYPTHSLFLSDRSIYIVVFDLGRDFDRSESRIEYWLRQINTFAKSRPAIFLVGTHRDLRHESTISHLLSAIETKYRQNWCGNVRDVFGISLTKRMGLEELRRAILESATKLLSTLQVPAYYLTLKQLLCELKNETPDYIKFSAFEARAKAALGHTERVDDSNAFIAELRTALLFFTDCGTVLYFDTMELRDLIILDPKWLANTLSTIITFKSNFVNRQTGLLSVADLKQVWRNIPSEVHPRLLTIFSRFGIVYSFQSTLLLPDLVEDVNPDPVKRDSIWPPAPSSEVFEFGRSYRFQFYPLGFVSRVTVGMFTTLGQGSEFYLWKNGLAMKLPVSDFHGKPTAIQVLLSFDPTQSACAVSLRSTELGPAEKLLKTVIGVMESTISGFYAQWNTMIERHLVCSHCLRTNRRLPPRSFPLRAFAKTLQEGDPATASLICPQGQVPVSLVQLAPDLALVDLPVLYDLEIDGAIGKGGYGQVFRGKWQGFDVAVKQLHAVDEFDDSEATQRFLSFQKEVAVMARLQHSNLLCLYGVMLRPLSMVLELAPVGDLHRLLHDTTFPDSKFPWRLRLRIALDVANGMNFLHQLTPPLVHRDLRSPNIFLMTLDDSAPIVAKVADFGLAQALTTTSGITDRLETWQWMAPETFVLNSTASYDERADVYSFAIVLWELSSRKYPFQEYAKMSVFKVKEGICKETDPLRPTLDRFTCPSRVSNLVRSCWASSPSVRPTFFDIIYSLRRTIQRGDTGPSDSLLGLPVPKMHLGKPLVDNRRRQPSSYIVSMCVADNKLWTGSSDGTVSIYDTATDVLLSSRVGLHSGRVYKIVDLVRSGFIATASEDLVVNIWSKTTLDLVVSLPWKHSVMIRAIAAIVSDSKEYLWTSDATGKISSWLLIVQVGTVKPVLAQSTVLSSGDSVCSMAQLQDGGVAVGCDGTLLKLAPASLRELHRRPKVHRGKISCVAPAQEELLVAASEDYSISIWSLTLELLHRVSYHTGKVHALSTYGDAFLLSGGFDLSLCLYDLRSRMICGKRVWADVPETKLPMVSSDSISSICSDLVIGRAYIASRDGSLQVLHLESPSTLVTDLSHEFAQSALSHSSSGEASPARSQSTGRTESPSWQKAVQPAPAQLLARAVDPRKESPGH